MTGPVTRTRWDEAQSAEREYWRWPAVDSREFAGILAELADTTAWARNNLGSDHTPAGDWLEIGIGPMGFGCIHFFAEASGRRIVGVDPLEQIDPADIALPIPCLSAISAARSMYEHRVATGEATGLPESSFGFAVLHNMLDHVQDPSAVVRETRRVLRPDGILLLACDAHSLLSQVRHRIYTRRRAAKTWLVRAHPFRFRPSEIFTLLEENGFTVESHNLTSRFASETVGRARRLLVLGSPSQEEP
jgi:SAM-dependent methyltransferase